MLSGRGKEAERALGARTVGPRTRTACATQLRRLIQQGLAGWSTWGTATDLKRKKRMLASAAGRRSSSLLLHWQHDWEVEEAAKAALLASTTKSSVLSKPHPPRSLEMNVQLLQMSRRGESSSFGRCRPTGRDEAFDGREASGRASEAY